MFLMEAIERVREREREIVAFSRLDLSPNAIARCIWCLWPMEAARSVERWQVPHTPMSVRNANIQVNANMHLGWSAGLYFALACMLFATMHCIIAGGPSTYHTSALPIYNSSLSLLSSYLGTFLELPMKVDESLIIC